ncbi:MAG: hypothetical protein KME07_20635 [Pegethrix bostrychoides GSE-TBD4-15B]|jgi:hypothetical protein|uniref:DUF6816 domain-containing protein n=1 Tax=Pegethrix bostrychoides GSE-TBD4-15B TaxID=2839662 RepID=A0A951PDX8_9CYAN|nr:hypothetical protein [Pegethrix bostrychoides GSE-TBD4-15B]
MNLTKWKSRLFWFSVLALWLLCSGVAFAVPATRSNPLADRLADRIARYPDWHKPLLQPVRSEDLGYPDWFRGDWQVVTTLVDLAAPLAPIVTPGFEGNRQFLNQPIQFDVRFVEQPASQPANQPASQSNPGKLVSDRAYNGAQLAKAYLGERSLLAVKLDPKNPNRQITLLKGDRQLVSTITARATEALHPDRFITSEFFQQEFRGGSQIYFNEVENTTAYQHQPDASQPISADQITAIYLSPQDADYFKTLNGSLSDPRPVALYRYHMEFRKPTGLDSGR